MNRSPATRVSRRRLTRRDLFKAGPLTGAAAAALALGLHGRTAEATVTSKGVCRFCLLHCGIEATTRGGRLVQVQGDLHSKTRGFLCLHGHALTEVVHSQARLTAPLVRRGDTLHEVSWDDAYAVVAEKLEKLRAAHGPQSLMVQTGWPMVRHPLPWLLHRFCHVYGTPNLVSVASLCEASLRMAQALTVGSKYPQAVALAKTLVIWGANPEHSAPAIAHQVHRRAEEGRMIVIDPVKNGLARRASEHLHLRPGTDGALALGLAHVIISERLYDEAFVRENVTGFEAFAALCAQYEPQRVQAITTVPVEQLTRVARRFAQDRPTRIWGGLGVEQHQSGVQTVRAQVALEALVGVHDDEWAKTQLTPPSPTRFGDEMLPQLYRMVTPSPAPPEPAAKPLGYHEFPLFEMYNREAQGNLFARAVLEGKPYPLRGLLLLASNPVLTAPGSAAVRRAVDALEVMVTIDPFLSASARLSDVVLPACTFAEAPVVDEGEGPRRNDDADGEVSERGVVDPQGEARSDDRILFELARAMGMARYFPWKTLREALSGAWVPFMADPAHQPKPKVASAARYGTPTGKIELDSTLLREFGYPGLPEWTPPRDPLTARWPLWLVSGPRDQAFINSQFRSIPSVRAKMPDPRLRVHPNLGFRDGEPLALITEQGRLVLKAQVTDEVHPDAVVAPFGWEEANVNLLGDATQLDPISGFPALRAMRCRVERA